MQRVQLLSPIDEAMAAQLTAVWRRSVQATHDFLLDGDLDAMAPQVKAMLLASPHIYGVLDGAGAPLGFMLVEAGHVHMLFVDASARGMGLGKALLTYAVEALHADSLDVNEQNTQAVGFYQRMGFMQAGHSPVDDQGRPYPILHMKRRG